MDKTFDFQIACGGVTVQYCNSPTITEREIHPYHEILYCTDLNAVLYTDDRQLEIAGDCLFLIPKGYYHFFELRNSSRFTRLKISVPVECVGSTVASAFWKIDRMDGLTELLLKKLCGCIQEKEKPQRDFYIQSAVSMLLAELGTYEDSKETGGMTGSMPLQQIVSYISRNLSADLRIEALAKENGVSPSYIQHGFKKEMGISLHRYITQKRMMAAHERIAQGNQPTKIYLDCGYKDYSSFYKAYLQFFGCPPSCDNGKTI